MRFATWVGGALLAGFAALPAFGGQVSDSFDVTLTIEAGCLVTADNDLSFGTASFLDNELTGTADFTIKCTTGTSGTIALDAGLGIGATASTRMMTNGANQIEYALYADAGHATVWGDGVNGGSTIVHVGDGSEAILTVYGKTTASGAAPAAGAYSDTITITVSY